MLCDAGWVMNTKRVERIWRRERLKVPQKQPKKGRLWLNDGSCIRLRPERPNHVWSYDFVENRTHDGRRFRMLNVIDEFSRECLAIEIGRKLNSTAVIDVLTDLFILRGVPGHVRSDMGLSLSRKPCGTGSMPWERKRRSSNQAVRGMEEGQKTVRGTGFPTTGYCESFNSKLRDELLDGEIFYSLAEARVVIEAWRVHYNTAPPHSSLGYRPPAPETIRWPSKPDQSSPRRRLPWHQGPSCTNTENGPPDGSRPPSVVCFCFMP